MTYSLAEIKKMLEEISPWPWQSDRANHICDKEGNCVYWTDGIQEGASGSNSDFIASAPQIISELVAEVGRLQEKINHLERIHRESVIRVRDKIYRIAMALAIDADAHRTDEEGD